MVTFDSTDLDNAVEDAGMVHEDVANTDNVDASELKQGYTYQAPPLVDGLVGWWPLHGELAQDYSGNGNHGSLNSGVTTGVAGRGGLQAMSFNGSDGIISILPAGMDMGDVPEVSFSFWFYARDVSSQQSLFYWDEDGGYGESKFQITSGSEPEFHVGDGSTVVLATGSTVLSTNTWYHVVCIKNENTGDLDFYLDGIHEENASFGTQGPTNDDLYLGYLERSGGAYFDGLIYDFRLYNRILSESEIQILYEWGSVDVATPPTDGVARYALDGNANDVWGSNNGTNNGATFVDDAIRGQAASFDGTDDWVELSPNPLITGSNNRTVSFWVYWTNNGEEYETFFGMGGDGSTGSRWDVRPNNGNLRIEVQGAGYNSSLSIPTNGWVHCVAVLDGGTLGDHTLYVNSESEGVSGTTSVNTTNGRTVLSESGNNAHPSRNMEGYIDDVRIYDYALEPHEVHELYQWGTFGRDCRKLVSIV